MRNKIPRDAFPEQVVMDIASRSCQCQWNAPMVERNSHIPSCRVGQAQEYLGKRVSWEWNGEPVESLLESAKEMHERYCREVDQFDECNPTDAKEFDAQVKGLVKDILIDSKKRGAPWNRCQECGRFIPFEDLDSGKARHQMVTPDSEVSEERYETLCRDHNSPTVK